MENRSLGRGRVIVPVVGLGTWQRLEAAAAGQHREVVDTAIAAGIRLLDTSPMYGDAERLLADVLGAKRNQAVIADKVWTPSPEQGAAQLARAVDWYGGRVDLMQIHNLVAWPTHLGAGPDQVGPERPARARLPGRHRPSRPGRGERRRWVAAMVRAGGAGLRAAAGHHALTSRASDWR